MRFFSITAVFIGILFVSPERVIAEQKMFISRNGNPEDVTLKKVARSCMLLMPSSSRAFSASFLQFGGRGFSLPGDNERSGLSPISLTVISDETGLFTGIKFRDHPVPFYTDVAYFSQAPADGVPSNENILKLTKNSISIQFDSTQVSNSHWVRISKRSEGKSAVAAVGMCSVEQQKQVPLTALETKRFLSQ